MGKVGPQRSGSFWYLLWAGIGGRLQRWASKWVDQLNGFCSRCERRSLKAWLLLVCLLVSAYLLWVILDAFD